MRVGIAADLQTSRGARGLGGIAQTRTPGDPDIGRGLAALGRAIEAVLSDQVLVK
jgi:hypothetical protein